MIHTPYSFWSETFLIPVLLSGIFACVTAFKFKADQIPLNYHAIHAIGLLLYGFSFRLLSNDATDFFRITVIYLLFYGIAELIFGLQMLLQKDRMLFRIIVIRMVIGFITALSAVGLYISLDKYIDLTSAIKITGVLFIVGGLNLFFFKSVIFKLYKKENVLTFSDTIV